MLKRGHVGLLHEACNCVEGCIGWVVRWPCMRGKLGALHRACKQLGSLSMQRRKAIREEGKEKQAAGPVAGGQGPMACWPDLG